MAEEDPIKRIVEQHFRIYESRQELLQGGVPARLFFLMFPDEELEKRYDGVRKALLAADPDLIVFLRREGGEDILVITPRAPVLDKGTRVNWILFAATILTTVLAGAMYWQGYRYVDQEWTWSVLWSPHHLMWGFITFALPLMAILAVHESAHYIAARRHGLRASLPYFIPFPPFALPIGTLGAFIRLKDPLPDRKALFDVGASGPLAGFALAIPILFLGAMLTSSEAVELPDADRPEIAVDVPHLLEASAPGQTVVDLPGTQNTTITVQVTAPPDVEDWDVALKGTVTVNGTSWTDERTAKLDAGEERLWTFTIPANATDVSIRVEWDDGLIRFGDPLFVKGMEMIGFGNEDYLTHPTFFAGWVGLLITGINLLPAGQLDGGHVARAILGENMRWAAAGAMALLFYLAFTFQTWILMAVLILFMGIMHPPPLNDRVPLDMKRKVLAGVVVLVFALTFVARPVIF